MEIDKLAWIRLDDAGRLLLVRSRGKQLFYLPGGKREPGEDDAQALGREIKEELSVDLAPASIRPAGTFRAPADGQAAGTIVKLGCYFADCRGELGVSAEIAELAWFDPANPADRERCSPATRLVLDWLVAERPAGRLAPGTARA